MTAKDCKRFESCSAPLCPIYENGISGGIWYPDEEICASREFCNISWISNQKKIAKQAKNLDFYFTHEMLSQDCIIRKGIEGLDPDKTSIDDRLAVNKWLKAHPKKREVSKEERENARKRMLELKQRSTLSENSPQRLKIDNKTADTDREKDKTKGKPIQTS